MCKLFSLPQGWNKKAILSYLAYPLLLCLLLSGCNKNITPIDCPFTDLGWETTEEELFAAQGESASSYASTYGGTTYTYQGSYYSKEGTLKYMYDDKGTLMSVAWAYSAPDEASLLALYNEIHSDLEKTHGKSGYNTENATNYGDVWKLKEGHIILSVMLTNTNKALQIAYVNPLNNEE